MIGNPNLVMTFAYLNLAANSLERVSTNSYFSHLVTYSIVVMMYLELDHQPGVEKGPTKSISHISKVELGFTKFKGI